MPKFKTDENLPIEVAEILRQAGYDTMTVLEQELGGYHDEEKYLFGATTNGERSSRSTWTSETSAFIHRKTTSELSCCVSNAKKLRTCWT